ncbi:MAG: hypothetical protein LH465_06195 [Sphingomonas bacterium]|nr:hypothetical protein [Sphingomonas bacterium]
MTRFLTAAAVLAASLTSVAASAASYSAKPIAPVAAKRIIVRDIVWSCGPAACQGATDTGRPILLCQGLAKKAGVIESFIVDGRALAAAELNQCNTAARGGQSPVLARAN